MTDITLKEIQEICIETHHCSDCPLYKYSEYSSCYLDNESASNYDLAYLEQKIKDWRDVQIIKTEGY
jgi:hypothetical protein